MKVAPRCLHSGTWSGWLRSSATSPVHTVIWVTPLPEEFPETLIRPLLDQFSTMQGLRILVSGGEPTLYSHFPVLNDALPDYPVRAVLLSNGIGVTKRMVSDLNFTRCR
jgi:molybdenum cofactor biosynthesis enzyme MoaA